MNLFRKTSVLLLSLVSLCGVVSESLAQQRQRPAFNPERPSVHDPVLIKQDSVYYLFATGMGIQVMSSKDLKTWKPEPPVFAEAPAWAVELIPGYKGHTWAPDIIWHNGRYHIFYSCSAFGKNTSAIGHASTPTLHRDDPAFGWTDHGKVVQSVPNRDRWNAIDANIVIDEAGTPWMSFGSFWDGIKLVQLTPDMHAVAQPERWYNLASRKGPQSTLKGDNAIEAPFIFKKGEYYYQWVSWDYCCRAAKSTYKIAVGRSEKVQGPYLDREGNRLDQGGGTLVMQGNDDWAGVGHCAAYTIDGRDILVAHGYYTPERGRSVLVVRDITWDADGWPVVSW